MQPRRLQRVAVRTTAKEERGSYDSEGGVNAPPVIGSPVTRTGTEWRALLQNKLMNPHIHTLHDINIFINL